MNEIERCLIISTYAPEPVYHRLSKVVENQGRSWSVRYVGVARCGAKYHLGSWWSANLRRDHADLFARPCSRCYREEME